MQIRLQHLTPKYLEPEKIAGSEIWGREVSFNSGEHVHIIAPSGSGKTSLIHFMYGLRKDFSGNILYDDKGLSLFSIEDFATCRQQKVSVIFQDLRLFNEHSMLENLEIKRMLNPYHPAKRITEMAACLGVKSKLGNIANTCSYGEQQRFAIIRALLQPFHFLLLDEPFSHLDDDNRLKAFNLIKEECTVRGASMIFADLKKLDFFSDERILRL